MRQALLPQNSNKTIFFESKQTIQKTIFSKLIGLSTTRHEKLCIALLQRLETEMEAANVLHRRETGSKKVAKAKNKRRRELQNLICSVNYDRR